MRNPSTQVQIKNYVLGSIKIASAMYQSWFSRLFFPGKPNKRQLKFLKEA